MTTTDDTPYVADAVFRFAPKEDITAYELAVIFMGMSENVFGDERDRLAYSLTSTPRLVDGPIIAHGETLNKEPRIRRHFVPYEDVIEIPRHSTDYQRRPWLARIFGGR